MQRRSFLSKFRNLAIVVAGGQVWRAFGQETAEFPEGAAFVKWRDWQTDMDKGPLALVHAAILSSNAFNSQPWLFRIANSKIEMYVDTQRNLGAFDPYLRELFLSIGCALENLLLAVRANHFDQVVTIKPGKLTPPSTTAMPELAVEIELSRTIEDTDDANSELFLALPHRHTNRNLFDASRELPADFARSLENLAVQKDGDVKLFLFTGESQRKTIADLVWDSSNNFSSGPEVRRGSKSRFRSIEILEKEMDGIYVGKLDSLAYSNLMMSGRLFGLIAVRDRYDRPQTIRAGRVWQRAHLLATARGITARPMNGAVEIIDHERRLNLKPKTLEKLAGITGDHSWQPSFMFYMGYPTVAATASARRPLKDVIAS